MVHNKEMVDGFIYGCETQKTPRQTNYSPYHKKTSASFQAAKYLLLTLLWYKKPPAITGLENTLLQLIISFLTVSTFIGFKQGFVMEITSSSILPILVLGLLNTGIGCYFYFSSIDSLPIQTVAILGYLEPLSAVLFSVIILNESMSPLQIIGAVLIISGAVFSEICGGNKRRSG